MDPPPLINKAFALISQEEEQNSDLFTKSTNPHGISLAVATPKTYNNARNRTNRPICTHCGIQGHIVDRCYKLHGYPPGYRQKYTPQRSYNNVHGRQYQPGTNTNANAVSSVVQRTNDAQGDSEDTFTQCQNILNMLQTKLASVKTDSEATTSYLAGTCPNMSQITYKWIIDSGASTHICFSQNMFDTLESVNTSIVLPDLTRIDVHYAGVVRICGSILLKRVLFVPEFKHNLLSINALTEDNELCARFNADSCIIQERSTLRTIGKGKLEEGLYILNNAIATNGEPFFCCFL